MPPSSILLIDDSDSVREVLRGALECEGYRILDARDGPRGVKVFEGSRPAMVLLDILMRAKEGIETLREMRKLDPTSIVFTMTGGDWGANDSRAARLLGANRAFLKPIRLSELLEAIREELSRFPGSANK